jgi:mannan endo-1,4-beta-mannosidase
MFKRGGIIAFCWHWMDPSLAVETFYTESSNNKPFTTFDLGKAFTDSTFTTFNTNSAEYKAIIRDLDIVAALLKVLGVKDIPVLWRPIHEASGRWFWWGTPGPKACKALWRLIYDRFTTQHKLNHLIWVWTTDEAADAVDWYPGDNYVDILGRDYYYYPRIANHGSLVASFENLKNIFGGTKLITLSENGSIPHPDSLKGDGAAWSYFMPWYGDYTMDGWAHDNTADDWKAVMNNPYVITLDQMPGWAAFTPTGIGKNRTRQQDDALAGRSQALSGSAWRLHWNGPLRHPAGSPPAQGAAPKPGSASGHWVNALGARVED